MCGLTTILATLGVAALAMAVAQPQGGGDLGPGDPAPRFTLPGSDGRTYDLSEFKGRQAVVLAWFPKAFTGG